MYKLILMMLICLAVAAGACGEATADALVVPDPAEAATCAELADMLGEMTSDMVGMMGDRTVEEMEQFIAENEADGVAWFETANAIGMRTGDLCDLESGEFEELACERLLSIEPEGEGGQDFLDDAKPEGCP